MRHYILILIICILCLNRAATAESLFQKLTYDYKNINFILKVEDKQYKRTDTLRLLYEVKNNSNKSIWVCDHSTFTNNPDIGLKICSDLKLYLYLGMDWNIEYGCPKYYEVKKGRKYTKVFKLPCDTIISYYENHRSGKVGSWYRYTYPLVAQIALFEQDYLKNENMIYISSFNSPIGKLREEDNYKYITNVKNIELTGIIINLFYE